MDSKQQTKLRERAESVSFELLEREAWQHLCDVFELLEREAWQHLCDVFERLTGESLDDAESKKHYIAFASLCKIWAEHFANWKRSDCAPEEQEPQDCLPIFSSELRSKEREAWIAMDSFLDKIVQESWGQDAEPETKKCLAVTDAVCAWTDAMCDVRLLQGDDGVRWGRNVLTSENAKFKRFRLSRCRDE